MILCVKCMLCNHVYLNWVPSTHLKARCGGTCLQLQTGGGVDPKGLLSNLGKMASSKFSGSGQTAR